MIKIAFVGAELAKWDKAEVDQDSVKMHLGMLMRDLLNAHGKYTFISGASPKGGVDIWAEEIADELELPKLIFPPDIHRWQVPGMVQEWGYKDRNIVIAAICDELYCVDPVGIKSGGEWTLLQAAKLGKTTHRLEIDAGGMETWF